MQFTETYNREKTDVLTGRFKSHRDAYHAQEILTDFGYPRDATRVIELSEIARGAKTNDEHGPAKLKGQVMRGLVISGGIGLSIIIMSLAGLFLKNLVSLPEMGMVISAWVAFTIIGVMICVFVGALVWMLINSIINMSLEGCEEAVRKGKVLISVAVRTPADARDIAREWRDIGGEVG
ncbi:MAG: hypothetical protein L0226_04160 [Acidobacteria bacterium]|nr:hypothetical protein [Acidobacteriota bacterium]